MFSEPALEALKSHDWPGNVRELANVIEHATILCDRPPIAVEHLPDRFSGRPPRPHTLRTYGPRTLREIEMQAIQEALERNEGSKPKAAEELGVSLKTLYNRLNQAGTFEKSA